LLVERRLPHPRHNIAVAVVVATAAVVVGSDDDAGGTGVSLGK
jgi:hypothetical protein